MSRGCPESEDGATSTTPIAADDSTSYVQQLRARRTASRRLPGSDPWHYPPPSAAGYADAARHLLASGLLPAPNLAALRDMWKFGGESRCTAQIIVKSWREVAA